ncbi:hypothetical protein, partial [Nocardiopsis sp. TNDT3]|uniref:hypothetical protein n=1 Tax=Nocardiopsis sp. TNDT3 TaxID=2249354 RepID=UPI001E5F4DBA
MRTEKAKGLFAAWHVRHSAVAERTDGNPSSGGKGIRDLPEWAVTQTFPGLDADFVTRTLVEGFGMGWVIRVAHALPGVCPRVPASRTGEGSV